jgi:uncharacterized Ntn-hydrolase superfamily protein
MRSVALLSCWLAVSPAWATWSIGVLDPNTKTIAVAAASCTGSVYGVAGVVPGVGLVFAQAASNMRAKNKALEWMRAGVPNEEILKRITSFDFDRGSAIQQYALLTFAETEKPLTFTGNETPDWRGVFSFTGVTAQGNTLVGRGALEAAYLSLVNATWKSDAELTEAVVTALAAGSKAGGDRRCGDTTASSAFVTVFRASDDAQSPYVDLVVRRSDANGGNAVKVLQDRVAEWKWQSRHD